MMCRVTHFYVHRQASGATVCEPELFRDRDAALSRAAFIGRRTPSQVYMVTGDLKTDLWAAPKLLAEFDGLAPVALPESNVIAFRRAG
jgi:hypothetical protein